MDLDVSSPLVWVPAVLAAAVVVGLVRGQVVETVVAGAFLALALFTFGRMARM